MNRDQIEGNWYQMKGKAQRVWAELTDDDFKRAEGSTNKLFGIIQEKFGHTKDEIKRRLDAIHL